jgi:ubiquinone/menaquinone biosynthesis C-methylase UbiE
MNTPNNPPSDREQLDRVRDRFTRTASVFADFAISDRSAEAERLAALASPAGNEIALDLACGPGTFARAFAPRVRWICGLDLTPAMLARARKDAAGAGHRNLCFVCGNAYQLPYADETFHLAVCGYTFHHMNEPQAALLELARVLRPGGRMALLDLVAPDDPAKTDANTKIEQARDASHVRALTAGELGAMLSRVGCRVVSRERQLWPRDFEKWMGVAGWKRGDAPYREARQLMEASIPEELSGFFPRYVSQENNAAGAHSASGGERPIEFMHTSVLLIAEKQ